jgi:hypothetical protein
MKSMARDEYDDRSQSKLAFHPLASMKIQLFSLQLSTSSSAFLSPSSKPSNGSFVSGKFIRSIDLSCSNRFPTSLTCSASCLQLLRCVMAFPTDDMIMLARLNASTLDGASTSLAMLRTNLVHSKRWLHRKCLCVGSDSKTKRFL